MKHFTLMLFLLSSNAIIPVQAQDDLMSLWKAGLLYPENFDNYVAQNRDYFQSKYNACPLIT